MLRKLERGGEYVPEVCSGFVGSEVVGFYALQLYEGHLHAFEAELICTDLECQSTFHPATVSTNLLFFQKGTPTKDIWYYEHRLPEGQKSYSKTKVIQFNEFAPMIEWWEKREENEVAWRVKVEDLKGGFDLDVKNPNSTIEAKTHTVDGLLQQLKQRQAKITDIIHDLESALN